MVLFPLFFGACFLLDSTQAAKSLYCNSDKQCHVKFGPNSECTIDEFGCSCKEGFGMVLNDVGDPISCESIDCNTVNGSTLCESFPGRYCDPSAGCLCRRGFSYNECGDTCLPIPCSDDATCQIEVGDAVCDKRQHICVCANESLALETECTRVDGENKLQRWNGPRQTDSPTSWSIAISLLFAFGSAQLALLAGMCLA